MGKGAKEGKGKEGWEKREGGREEGRERGRVGGYMIYMHIYIENELVGYSCIYSLLLCDIF